MAAFIFQARSQIQATGILDFNSAFLMLSLAKATDLRDKVYGILGVCFEEEIPSLLSVDYERPWQDIYRDATRFTIFQSDYRTTADGLPFVLRVVDHHSIEDFGDEMHSSWVPRYELGNDRVKDAQPLFIHAVNVLPDEIEVVRRTGSSRSIDLFGRRLGVIRDVGMVLDEGSMNDTSRISEFVDEVLKFMKICRHDAGQIARTLVADTSVRGDRSVASDLEGANLMIEKIGEGITMLAMSELKEDSDKSTRIVSTFWTAFQEVALNRRFAVTEDNAVLLVPRLTQSGDVVASLYADAGGAPYVLRKFESRFKLVGLCYYDGKMPGQQDEKFLDEENEWLILI